MKRNHLIMLITSWLLNSGFTTSIRVKESGSDYGISFYVEDHFIEKGSLVFLNPHFYTVFEAFIRNRLDCKYDVTWNNTKTTMHIWSSPQTSWITP